MVNKITGSRWSPIYWLRKVFGWGLSLLAFSYTTLLVGSLAIGLLSMMFTPFLDRYPSRAIAKPPPDTAKPNLELAFYNELAQVNTAFALDFHANSVADYLHESPLQCLVTGLFSSEHENLRHLQELWTPFLVQCELALHVRELVKPELERIVSEGSLADAYYSFILLDQEDPTAGYSSTVGPFITLEQCRAVQGYAIDNNLLIRSCRLWRPLF